MGIEAASIGKTPVFIIDPDKCPVIWKPDEEFLLESNESDFWVSFIGLSFNAADLTRFIVGIKPAKIKTNLPASKSSFNDGKLWKRKKDNINKIKIIK